MHAFRTHRELNPVALFGGGSSRIDQVFRIEPCLQASHRPRLEELFGMGEQPDAELPLKALKDDLSELHDELLAQRALLEEQLRRAMAHELRRLFTAVLTGDGSSGNTMDKAAASDFTGKLVTGLQAVCDALLGHRTRSTIRVSP